MRTALRDITDFTVSVLDGMVSPVFPAETVISILSPALDAPAAVFQRTDPRTGATSIRAPGCSPAQIAAFLERSRTGWADHPHMAAAVHGRLTPSTAQDAFGGERKWRSSPVREFLVLVGGWDQQVSLPLAGGPSGICGLSFARSGQDFSDDDVALLTAVQPLLQALERHAALAARWSGHPAGPADVAPEAARDARLTARELDVLVLLAEGRTAFSAARRLCCSPRTVEKHASNLYRKLGVGDRVTAVLEAQRRHLVPVPAADDR